MLTRFVDSFKKAVAMEMDAMRARLGPFEVPLGHGERQGASQDEGEYVYGFRIAQPNDKLVLGVECSLTSGTGREYLVEVTGIDRDQVTVRCAHEIDLQATPHTLVIYPWFLYEKLQAALQSLVEDDRYHTGTALELFGKLPPRHVADAAALHSAPAELNASQLRAVQLSCECSPAFVWGPPGTGKTTTLGCIVTALLQQGRRILVTSTTNAAIDQALARLVELEPGREAIERGEVVRLGQTQDETHGASLREVVERPNARLQTRLTRLEERQLELRQLVTHCDGLLDELGRADPSHQLGLFGEAPESVLGEADLAPVFSPEHVLQISALESDAQTAILKRRRDRLQRCRDLCKQKGRDLRRDLVAREAGAVDDARVIFATMTNVYISRLMESQRFDAVIVEEAGMAVLPTLFYCAALASAQVVMVGDPQQLPPIVQSSEAYVYRAMGRSIFEVTVPQPHDNQLVVMLDTQYRMHPRIGDLVGELFYDRRLRHGSNTADTERIAALEPFAGEPLVVVDTQGQSQCATPEGSYSRYNEDTARVCVELAAEAVAAGVESVAVITPYAEQSRLIRRLLSARRTLDERVECRTVHRFQGGERDMVILDTVDAAPLSPGVLLAGRKPGSSARNLINVSISRARGKLVIVADVAYFAQHDRDSIVSEMLRRATAVGTKAAFEA